MTTRVPYHLCAVLAALLAALLAGCASNDYRAPVTEHGGASGGKRLAPVVMGKTALAEGDWRPRVYVVQKGDTLYGIAFNYGLDYHDIAALNNIQNPDMIQAGQELQLFPPGAVVAGKAAPVAQPEEARLAGADARTTEIPVKSQPQVAKLPYSEGAAAQIEKMQVVPQLTSPPQAVASAVPEIKLAETKSEPLKVEPLPAASGPVAEGADELDWGMPTEGKLLSGFSESDNRKGIDLAGKLGQPVLASASGKVVYSGSGLRGYGKLIIIKHNNTYLSAYAHNNQILVKEGQVVAKGQKIAEMGNSDSSQVMLHFEIRKLGKPVDPAKYLPKS